MCPRACEQHAPWQKVADQCASQQMFCDMRRGVVRHSAGDCRRNGPQLMAGGVLSGKDSSRSRISLLNCGSRNFLSWDGHCTVCALDPIVSHFNPLHVFIITMSRLNAIFPLTRNSHTYLPLRFWIKIFSYPNYVLRRWVNHRDNYTLKAEI